MARAGIRGNPNLARFWKEQFRGVPAKIEAECAILIAREFQRRARDAFTRGVDVYGKARPASAEGGKLYLIESGLTKGTLGFVAERGRVRSTISQAGYVKYLIGKYRILPNGPLPEAWVAAANRIIQAVGARHGLRAR